MKASAKKSAAIWGKSVDVVESQESTSTPSSIPSTSGGYRGFGIAPPRSYEVVKGVAAEKEKRKAQWEKKNNSATPDRSRGTPNSKSASRPSPYPSSRPSSSTATPIRTALPPNVSSLDPATTLSGTPLRPSTIARNSLLSTGKKSVASPFKPPSFIGTVQKSDR